MIIASLGGVALCSTLLTTRLTVNPRSPTYHFVVPETPLPKSLDPLDADILINLHASQMVHRSILEVTEDGTLTSSLLKSFNYNAETALITFEVNETAHFTDGSKVGTKDIANTIIRMAAKRPSFPILRHIKGLKEWSAQSNPHLLELPGVTYDKRRVQIQLERHVHNPLFRFALPLFGVTKSSCTSLEANALDLVCATSGYYKITQLDRYKITFEVANPDAPSSLPRTLIFDYFQQPITQQELVERANGNHVLFLQHITHNDTWDLNKAGFRKIDQPKSRFTAWVLNSKHEAFSTVDCRRTFNDLLRINLAATGFDYPLETSLLGEILPGYLSAHEMRSHAPELSAQTKTQCEARMQGLQLSWAPSNHPYVRAIRTAVERTAEQLKMTLVESDRNSKNLDLIVFSSGFWAFDPVGDVQMLFTPNLHEPLRSITSDPKLRKMLDGLEFIDDPVEQLSKINQYLYEQGQLNIFMHFQRAYLTKGPAVSSKIPIAITPPAPWQLFNAENE